MFGSSDNNFRLIGIVKGNPKALITRSEKKVSSFILCIKDAIKKEDIVDVKCFAIGTASEQAIQWCRDGNVVGVIGGLSEIQRKVMKTQIHTSIGFIVTDIFLIKQITKKKLSLEQFKNIINTYTFEDF